MLTACRASILFAAIALGPDVRADILEITDAGRDEILKRKLAVPKPHANGRGQFLQGQIIVRRDDADRPTLPNPRTFFIFRPLPECRPSSAPEQDKEDRDPENPFDVKLRFTWTRGMTHHLDTLDDVRGMVSNRDLRYRNGNEALDALLAEIDPSGTLGLKKNMPTIAEPGVVAREGWMSLHLLRGPMTVEERTAWVRRMQSMPIEDPLGYTPLDPLHWFGPGNNAVFDLVEGAARAAKHGEVEPGVRASCLAVARFICEQLFVTRSDVPVGSREVMIRLNAFSLEGRHAVRNCIDLASAPALARPPPAIDARDDLKPVNVFDRAHTALDIAAACVTPREEDLREFVESLAHAAGGRADFAATGPSEPIPGKLTGAADAIGRHALEVLVKIAAPTSGAPFREQLLGLVFSANDQATAHAAREAIVLAGITRDAEVSRWLDTLFQMGTHGREDLRRWQEHAIYILRKLPGHITDPRVQQLFHHERSRRLDQLAARLSPDDKDSSERRFVDAVRSAP